MDEQQQPPGTFKFRPVIAVMAIIIAAGIVYVIYLNTINSRQRVRIHTLLENVDSLRKIVNPVEEQKDSIARLLDIERVKADTIN